MNSTKLSAEDLARIQQLSPGLKELEHKEKKNIPISTDELLNRESIIYNKSLEALAERLPQLLKDCPKDQMFDIIQKEVEKIKNQLASLPADVDVNKIEF